MSSQELVRESPDVKNFVKEFLDSRSCDVDIPLWNQAFHDRFPVFYDLLRNDSTLITTWFHLDGIGTQLVFTKIGGTPELYIILMVLGWIGLDIVERLFTYPVKLLGGNLALTVFVQLHNIGMFMFKHHLRDLFQRNLYDTLDFILDRHGSDVTALMSAHNVFSMYAENAGQLYLILNHSVNEKNVMLRLVKLYSADTALTMVINGQTVFEHIMFGNRDPTCY